MKTYKFKATIEASDGGGAYVLGTGLGLRYRAGVV